MAAEIGKGLIYDRDLAGTRVLSGTGQLEAPNVLFYYSLHMGTCAALYCILWTADRKSTRLNSSHSGESRMPSSA